MAWIAHQTLEAMWEFNLLSPLIKVDSKRAIKAPFPRIGAEVPTVFVLEVKVGLQLQLLQLAQSLQLMEVQMVGEPTVEPGLIAHVVVVDIEVLGQISPRDALVQVP